MSRKSSPVTRDDLLVRRSKLEQSLATAPADLQLRRLLGEVDAALARMDAHSYGICEECAEPIEPERLIADPLVRFCSDHLPPARRDALAEDLTLAAQIQRTLLPPKRLRVADWDAAYHYEAANVVSGDFCDLLHHDGALHFVVGDVSGKGVPAALLMAHLHATFRALVFQGLHLAQVMARASRMFCESSPTTHFATLACGRAYEGGRVELSSAGHVPALVVRGLQVERFGATGLPLGMFCDEQFSTMETTLDPGDSILLCSDGLTEAEDADGELYGLERLSDVLAKGRATTPQDAIEACLADLEAFRLRGRRADDLTVMAIRRM